MARGPSPDFASPEVEAAFLAFEPGARAGLFALRRLIFETAAQTAGVGRVAEALRWGQPAYLTPETRAGGTIRLGAPKQGGFALYVHCRTTLLSDFRALFPTGFDYEGDRAIRFRAGCAIDEAAVGVLIARALTWRLRRGGGPRRAAP